MELGNEYAELLVERVVERWPWLGPGDEVLQHERTRSLRCVEQSDLLAVGECNDRWNPQFVGDQMRRKPCLPTDFRRRATVVPVELEDVARVVGGQFVDVVDQGSEQRAAGEVDAVELSQMCGEGIGVGQ